MRSDSTYPFLRNPAWSPDGQYVAIVRGTGGIAGEIWLVPSSGGTPQRIRDEPASIFSDSPVFTPDGRGLIHSSNRGGATNIWFLPTAGGKPVRLTTGPGPDESPTVSADGTVAFVNSRWRNTLEAYDLSTGSFRTLLTHTPFIWAPAVSPDGREIAFSRSEVDGAWHVWSVPAEGGVPRRLTSTEAGEVYPRWTPDGASVLFHTWTAPRRIGRVSRAGGVPALLSFGTDASDAFADISPDGRLVAFTRSEAQSERVYTAPAAGGDATLLSSSPGTTPRWSPDGSRLAFGGHRGYSGGIFVIGADGRGERRLTNDGGWPVWWPDGRQIGYLTVDARGNQEIRVVSLDGSPPRALTSVRLVGTNHPFAVSPDGRTLVASNAVHVSDEIWLLEPRK
jgi:TolB protein